MVTRAAERALLEVQDVLESGSDPGRSIERLAEYQFIPETARLLEQAFGTASPMHVERLGKRDGQDKEMGMAMQGLTAATDQRLGAGRLWLGTMQVDVGRIDLRLPQLDTPFPLSGVAPTFVVGVDGLHFSSRTTERGRKMDIVQRLRIAGINIAGEQVNKLTMNYRLDNIDKQNTVEMMARDRKLKAEDKPRDEIDLLAMLRDVAQASSKAGTALTIERISADYAGHTFTLQGRFALKGAKDSAFDDLAQLFKRVDARFDIAVPMALVRAFALSAARRQLAGAGNAAQDPTELAQNMTDAALGKLLGEKLAKLDKGVLRATIMVRSGRLRVNGKDVTPSTPH